jgi:poly-gamma-glutamate synthesis protein (capsule biosynthesis protein)
MTPMLRRYDVTVGNLESTLSDDGVPQQGGDSFAAPPSVVGLLERAGVDAISLANNHTGDYQDAALLDTVRRLRRSRIRPFGAGRDLAAAGRAAVVRRSGTTFGFVGFNAIGETPRATPHSPGALSVRMPPRTGPLVPADLAHVSHLVRRLAERVDVVVVLPHWGTQYTHHADPIERRVARRLVQAGADLVVGGHPHWVQGLDLVRRAVVAHSLGNFVFDMDFMTETQQGVVLEATFWGARLKAVDLVPYRMDGDFAPRRVHGPEAAAILDDVWSNSTGPFRAR